MRPETEKLVAEVELRSGFPVQVIPVRDLGVVAKVTLSPMATGSYVVQYRPGIAFKDYAVAAECAQVLRLLALPQRDRCQFGTSPAAIRWGMALVRAHLGKGRKPALPDEAIEGFAAKLVGGLLTQLRSIPISMRIDQWISSEYPSLADQQVEAITLQQSEALGSLSPAIREAVPEEIVAGSVLMNAAYAAFCDRLLGGNTFAVPYVAAGFQELAEALLVAFDGVPADPSSDMALVDRWAAEIGLSEKYRWIPISSAALPES